MHHAAPSAIAVKKLPLLPLSRHDSVDVAVRSRTSASTRPAAVTSRATSSDTCAARGVVEIRKISTAYGTVFIRNVARDRSERFC